MHPFHDHLRSQLNDALSHGVVVVVDPPGAFSEFFEELTSTCAASDDHPAIAEIAVGGRPVRYTRFDGSWFAVRDAVEPFFAGDEPPSPPILVYVPAATPEAVGHVLLEIERAGSRLDWKFNDQARTCLRRHFTDGNIDELLEGRSATYADVVALLDQGGGKPSHLKVIFGGADDLSLLVRWLAEDGLDSAIAEKAATGELYRLVAAKVGLEIPAAVKPAEARARLARHVLLTEFRLDLQGQAPSTLAAQPFPTGETQRHHVRTLARRFRREYGAAYVVRARQVEQEFRLAHAKLQAHALGAIDTFEFEERLLLGWCAELLEAGRYADALAVVDERAESFWVSLVEDGALPRKEAWELCRRVAELGLRVAAVRAEVSGQGGGPESFVARYAAEDGWHRMDAAQRALESCRARCADERTEKAVGVVLREHERLLHDLAVGFSKALVRSGWTVPGVLHQTRIYPEVVARRSGLVAWFFVDALRFEMGVELVRHLAGAVEVQLQPAIAALPSITPVCMAALLPAAAADFSVVDHKGKVAARIEGVALPGVDERRKFIEARVPNGLDITLTRLLQEKPSELKKRVAGRTMVVVRSTEIDQLGEGGNDHLARHAVETVIGNLALAARRLAGAGVEHFVITADHGHLFGLRKGDDMKIDAPGGETVELHRRCWIGRGGSTPPGTVRVAAADLGYASDLEFVFPQGLGVFKAGGDLSFHHGSMSLQELVIPVLSFRMPAPQAADLGVTVRLVGIPSEITNRIFVVGLEVTPTGLFVAEQVELRVLLQAGGEQVGQVGMAIGADFDREAGIVRARPGTHFQVGLTVGNDDAAPATVVVLDPVSGAQLAASAPIPLNLLAR